MADGRWNTKKHIKSVLSILVANGLNYILTANECNVPRTSLRRWAREAGLAAGETIPRFVKQRITQNKKVNSEIEAILTKKRDGSEKERYDMLRMDLLEVKELALARIKCRIPFTDDIERIARSLAYLEQAMKTSPDGLADPVTNNNYLQIVIEQLKLMDHEPTDE